MSNDQSQRYWQTNLALIRSFLCIWAGISFGAAILLVRVLNHFHFGQLPLGFWIAQQGALLGFISLIFVYAFKMDRLDKEHHPSSDSPQRSKGKD